MSFWNSSAAIVMRSVARKVGLAPALSKLMARDGYEAAFHEALMGLVRPGDVVWDVGANIGHYTTRFALAVGGHGQVFAFEPSPINLERLQAATAGLDNVAILKMGLGAEAGTVPFIEGEDETGAVSHVTIGGGQSDVQVPLESGDAVVARGLARPPTMLKLDVEGLELEVFRGMRELLAGRSLRALGIEVHFGLLEARGWRNGPREIEKLLTTAGYEVRWTDPSHLVAERK